MISGFDEFRILHLSDLFDCWISCCNLKPGECQIANGSRCLTKPQQIWWWLGWRSWGKQASNGSRSAETSSHWHLRRWRSTRHPSKGTRPKAPARFAPLLWQSALCCYSKSNRFCLYLPMSSGLHSASQCWKWYTLPDPGCMGSSSLRKGSTSWYACGIPYWFLHDWPFRVEILRSGPRRLRFGSPSARLWCFWCRHLVLPGWTTCSSLHWISLVWGFWAQDPRGWDLKRLLLGCCQGPLSLQLLPFVSCFQLVSFLVEVKGLSFSGLPGPQKGGSCGMSLSYRPGFVVWAASDRWLLLVRW